MWKVLSPPVLRSTFQRLSGLYSCYPKLNLKNSGKWKSLYLRPSWIILYCKLLIFQRTSQSLQLNCSWFLQQRCWPGRRSHLDNPPRPPALLATDFQEHLPPSQVCWDDQLPWSIFPASGRSPAKTGGAQLPRPPWSTRTAGKLLWHSDMFLYTFTLSHFKMKCVTFGVCIRASQKTSL